MSDLERFGHYQIYHDLVSWAAVWRLADSEFQRGTPVNRDYWALVRRHADEQIRLLEYALAKRLPGGSYHHVRVERKV